MPCRVGITTRPGERKAEWERSVVGLRNWRILGTYSTKREAQDHEDRYARQNGCQASHGGGDGVGRWSVYRFDYTRTK